MSIRRKLAASVATGAFVIIGLATAIPAASASEGDGNCVQNDGGAGGDLCLYFNHGFAGARFNDPYSDNYGSPTWWKFVSWSGGSNGAGVDVKNNAASVQNWDTLSTGYVYYNSNQQGFSQTFNPWTGSDLVYQLKNNNASQGWS